VRQQTAARERRLCASSSSSCGCCSTRFSFSRKNVQSHHMVRWRRDKTGPLRDITKVVPFEFCARKEEEEKGWGEEILMWDNPHVSYHISGGGNLCRCCCCHRSTTTHHLKNETNIPHDDRHRLSGKIKIKITKRKKK
jgi:hypothetical protein